MKEGKEKKRKNLAKFKDIGSQRNLKEFRLTSEKIPQQLCVSLDS